MVEKLSWESTREAKSTGLPALYYLVPFPFPVQLMLMQLMLANESAVMGNACSLISRMNLQMLASQLYTLWHYQHTRLLCSHLV